MYFVSIFIEGANITDLPLIIAKASGLESEGPTRFKPRQLQATFVPGWQKITSDSQPRPNLRILLTRFDQGIISCPPYQK